MTAAFFQSSGDLIADRRYEFGQELAERGDATAAADLFEQAVELAPRFSSAWFALGEMRERLGQTADAVDAFRMAHALDPRDQHGAGLHVIRLAGEPLREMPADYVRSLFDQYAPRFDAALVEALSYRGPELLLTAVQAACKAANRPSRFESALDLGCGTGLGGAAFRPFVDTLDGVDLSPNMVEQARAKALYDQLAVGDLVPFMQEQAVRAFDLLLAADVLAYFADVAPLADAGALLLKPRGLFAFSVETHAGDGVVLGPKLRYAHGAAHVRTALARARLQLIRLEQAATRNEGGVPVPGLIVVAMK